MSFHPDAGMLVGMSFRDLKDYALDHGATMREVDRAVDRGALLHVISAAHHGLPEQFQGPIRVPERPMGKRHAQVQFELNKAKRDKSHPRKVDELEEALSKSEHFEREQERRQQAIHAHLTPI